MSDHKIEDIGLYASGKDRVDWARANMPILRTLKERLAVSGDGYGDGVGCIQVHGDGSRDAVCPPCPVGSSDGYLVLRIIGFFTQVPFIFPAVTLDRSGCPTLTIHINFHSSHPAGRIRNTSGQLDSSITDPVTSVEVGLGEADDRCDSVHVYCV